MIRKVSGLCITLLIALCMILPLTVSATDPYNTYYSNGTYDGGLWYSATGTASEQEYEHQDTYTSWTFCNATIWQTQTFTPLISMILTRIEIPIIQTFALAGDVSVDLYATVAGVPNGGALSGSAIPAVEVPATAAWVSCNFTPYALTAGTQYAMVMNTTATDNLYWGFGLQNMYDRGGGGQSNDSGGTWGMVSNDLAFKVYGYQTPYSMGRDNIIGNVTTGILADVGQRYDSGLGEYRVDRGVVLFNTSGLNDTDNVQSATLKVWVSLDASTTNFDLTMVDGGNTSSPLETSDYYSLYNSVTSLGSVTTAGILTTGYTTITLNATGLTRISKSGYTKFGLRSSRDIAGTVPTGDEYVLLNMGESLHPPILSLVYRVGGVGVPEEMNVSNVRVFNHFKELGDELFVWQNTLKFAETPTESPADYFVVQLQAGDLTVKGQVSVNEWGYSPLSIYFSAAQVTASGLGWKSVCSLVIDGTALYGAPTGFTAYRYQLVESDWKGLSGLTLDAWVKTCCNWLEDKNGVARNTYSTTGTAGWCINSSEPAQAWFLQGVPYLDIARPNLFLVGGGGTTEGTPDTGFAGSIYATIWGTYWTTVFTNLMSPFGLSGQVFLIILALGIAVVVGYVVREKTNDPNISLLMMATWIVAATALGMVPLGVLLAAALIAIVLLAHNLILSRT